MADKMKKEAKASAAEKEKEKKVKRVTSKDQLGTGMAKRATQTVEAARQSREARLNSIMQTMRKAQFSDSHQ